MFREAYRWEINWSNYGVYCLRCIYIRQQAAEHMVLAETPRRLAMSKFLVTLTGNIESRRRGQRPLSRIYTTNI